jgi:hypothetical protein
MQICWIISAAGQSEITTTGITSGAGTAYPSRHLSASRVLVGIVLLNL